MIVPNKFSLNKKARLIIGLVLGISVVIAGIFYFRPPSTAARNENRPINQAFSAYIAGYSGGILSKKSTLTIQLTQSLSDSSSFGKPVEGRLFNFKPDLPGQAFWVNASTIEFRPAEAMKPGQVYDVSFALSKIMETPKDLGDFDYSFQVIRQDYELKVNGLQARDISNLKDQQLTGEIVTADFASNDAVEKMLTVYQQNTALPVQWIHDNDRHVHRYTVDGVVRNAVSDSLAITVDGAPIGVDRKEKVAPKVPALGDFKVVDIRVAQSPVQYLSISFSDPLLPSQDFTGMVQVNDLTDLRFVAENNELRVYPNVRQAGTATIAINRGIQNIQGKKLQKSSNYAVVFEQIKPAVRLVGKGVILPSTDGLIFPFEAVNLRAVNLTIIKIYENNIPQFLQRNNLSGKEELRRVGRPILKKAIPLNTGGTMDVGRWNRYTLDLAKLINSEPGAIYQVRLAIKKEYATYYCDNAPPNDQPLVFTPGDDDPNAGEDEEAEPNYWDSYENEYEYGPGYDWRERDNPCNSSYYTSERTVSGNLLASDLGILAKSGKDHRVFVSVTNLKDTKPVVAAEVKLYDYQQQLINSGVTDGEGTADIEVSRKPFLLVANFNGQKGYLKMDNANSLSLSNFDVSGEEVQSGIKGFIYGERGVWRPGDSLHIAFMLEDKQQILPKNHPVIFELLNPKEQVEQKIVRTSSEHGIYYFGAKTNDEAITGNWSARVMVGNAVFNKKLKIETVKPNRLKIKLDFGTDRLTAKDEQVTGKLQVHWLTGAVAKNLKAEVDVMLAPTKTKFDKYANYTFDDPSKNFDPQREQVFEGNINQQGEATVNVNLNKNINAPGALNANFSEKVFEEGGNFSVDQFTIPYYPYASFVGLRLPEGDKRGMLLTDTTQYVDVVTLTAEGKPISREGLEMEIYKLDWRWWWDQSSDVVSNYVARTNQKLVATDTFNTANGKGHTAFRINYPDWGRYFIRITDPVSGHSAGKVFYMDWPGWAGRGKRENPGGATMLTFSTDKETYDVGDEVHLFIPAAEGGRALISVENGSRMLEHWWVETKKGETAFSFKTTPEMTPNVYVFVTLIQPHDKTVNDLPIRMYGVTELKIEAPDTYLHPQLAMADVLEPGGLVKMNISEKDGKPMAYTIAMVDEGLLDLTRFNTPDPHAAFYSREALGVKTWDLFDDVLGAYGGKIERLLAVGGDEMGESKENASVNRFKAAVRFLGPFYLAKGATASHQFIMPEYVGSVRTMVVAAEDGRYGHTDKTAPVKKPLMLLSTLPRVLGPDETVSLPVDVFAMEKNMGEVQVSIKPNDMFGIVGNSTKTLSFTDEGDAVVNFELQVKPGIGTGKVDIYATSGQHKAHETIDIQVRNPNPVATDVFEAMLEPGKSWDKTFAAIGMKGTNSAVLELSSLPAVNLDKRLRYLMDYPHGCVEQVTSAVFPQLYVGDFVELPAAKKQEFEQNIKAAITQLAGFQMNDGGFAYWPGMEEPDPWATSYVGNFLLEAQKKGYSVPPAMLRKWKNYQQGKANRWTFNKDYYRNDFIQAYRLYTLALAGQAARGAMNRMLEEKGISVQAKWRLAAAYALAGMKDVAGKIVDNLSYEVKPYREMAYTYGSQTRDEAMILETLILLDQRPKGFDLLKKISNDLGNNDFWMSTQTTAYSLMVVAKFAAIDKSGKPIDCSVEYNNGKKSSLKTAYPMVDQDLVVKEQNSVSLTNNGPGIVFVRLLNSGKPLKATLPEAANDLGLSVRYLDARGNAVDPARVAQTTTLKVEVTITNPGTRGDYNQLALTQIFPSGWEILNARMDKTLQIVQQSKPDYQDIRDDRVYTYFDLKANERKTFVLMVNASYAGKFYLPPVSCSAMYENPINARTEGKWVQVVKDQAQ